MRTSSYFRKLLTEYESPSKRNSSLFERMVKNAKTFADWNEIHRYGDGAYQSVALAKMKKLVLNQKRVIDIQRNILELFEIVTDSKEREQILKDYLKEHSKKDDLLFILTLSPTECDLWNHTYYLVMDYYSSLGMVSRGIKAREIKNFEIMMP